MAELGYKIYSGNKNEKEKGFTSGNPLPKQAAEDIMKHLQEKNPRTDYWLMEVEYPRELPKSRQGDAGTKQEKVLAGCGKISDLCELSPASVIE